MGRVRNELDNRDISIYPSISALPSAAQFGKGFAQVGSSLYVSDGVWWGDQNSKPYLSVSEATAKDIPPVYDIAMTNLASTVARSGLTAGNSRATDIVGYGTSLEWDANSGVVNGNFISVKYLPSTPLNLSNIDALMFEFGVENNIAGVSLQIIVGDVASTALSRFSYGNGAYKAPLEALSLLKSDFSTFAGAGADWSSIARVEFRFSAVSAVNTNNAAKMTVMRMVAGAKTRPLVLLTHDDNATQLYNAYQRNANLNLKPDFFVTDFELPGEVGFESTVRASHAQNKQLVEQGIRFLPHNIEHRAVAQNITGASISGTTVTLTLEESGYKGNQQIVMPIVGRQIIVEDSGIPQIDGTWTVTDVTLSAMGSGTSTVTYTVGAGITFNTYTVGIGGKMTVVDYDLVTDLKLMQSMIDRAGYPTSKRYMAYTYGRTSRAQRAKLAAAGISLARGTTSVTVESTFQINRKYGAGGVSGRYLNIPTSNITSVAGLQTILTRLMLTGGVASVYFHGDEGGLTSGVIDEMLQLLAQYRDNGLVDLINMDALEAHINARIV